MRASIEREVAACVADAGLGAADAVAIGCSGGPDSAALAAITSELVRARKLGGATLVYVDHGLRGGSASDGERVAELASRLGLDFRLAVVRVERRASLEAAAREARYRAFEEVARELGDVFVLLAHTASDQAETALMRAVRGTGVWGLAGIPPRRGRYLRPLLSVRRVEVEAYLQARGIAATEDPMNRDPAFSRNRFRHRWLPALAEENPRVEEALARLARSARDQREVLEYAAEALVDNARGAEPGVLDVAPIAAAPAPVAARALARVAEEVAGGPLGGRHIEALMGLVRRARGGTAEVALPGGGRAVREYEVLRLSVARPPAEPPELAIRGGGGPYLVRAWRPGDRMRPARLRGRSRKLSDLFCDERVPKRLRERARVVVREADGAIAWAEHIGRAHGAEIEVTLTPPEQVTSNRG